MTSFMWVKFFAAFTLVFGSQVDPISAECTHCQNSEAEISVLETAEEEFPTCGEGEFACQNRECVRADCLCDGVADCFDNSDELLPECRRVLTRFRSPVYSRLHATESRDRLSKERTQSLFRRRIYRVKIPRRQNLTSSTSVSTFCIVPPQPANGQWKLHQKFCTGNENCNVPQDVAVQLGSQLVYSCATDFVITGKSNVYCEFGGTWSSIPTCVARYRVESKSSGCTRCQNFIADISVPEISEEEISTCGEGEFECRNGECVSEDCLCDGKADCLDNSDELHPECSRVLPRNRPSLYFRMDAEESGERLFRDQSKSVFHETIYGVKIPRRETLTIVRRRMESSKSSVASSTCLVPPQPSNGQWKLHQKFCPGNENCDIPQGIALQLGSQLVYSCATGSMIRGDSDVYCQAGGSWSKIPTCLAITCSPLHSVSRGATCSRFGDRVNCTSSLLASTKAIITCNRNYGLEGTFSTGSEQEVECSTNGKWEPEPITCSPVCGAVNTPGQNGLAMNGILTPAGAFPWHADLWKEIQTPGGSEMAFGCSATIIDTNFVVTAAHCVIDETTGRTENPRRFRVTGGKNVVNDSNVLQNSPLMVKNIYRYCEPSGQVRNYTSDIALVELMDPFKFTPEVLPACLDISGFSEQTFKPGTVGRIDGFGRKSAGTPSPVSQTVEVTYVPNSECQALYDRSQNSTAIANDEFCGAYSNKTTVCDWDNGGGFVVKKSGLWHLMGISTMDLGLDLNGTQRMCGENPYSLYTKVPPYVAWIQDVMFQLQQYKSYPLCSFDLAPPPPTTNKTTIEKNIKPGETCSIVGRAIGMATMTEQTTWTSTTLLPTLSSPKSAETSSTASTPAITPSESTSTSLLPTPSSVTLAETSSTSSTPITASTSTSLLPTPSSVMSDEMSLSTAMPTKTPSPMETDISPSTSELSCSVPPQPDNGEWKLHKDACKSGNCHIPQGAVLPPGSRLVYTCASGFRIKGTSDVFCGINRLWSPIPECVEIKCSSLESVSRMVSCSQFNTWLPCSPSVPPNTTAEISCHIGYEEDAHHLSTAKTVHCKENGEWEPNPITCLPVCGIANPRQAPTIVNGLAANITEFPWHASLYRINATKGSMEFICGATIIQNNLLLTAAHCVYDDVYKAVETPGKFRVATGNNFRDFDSPLHNPRIVQKSTVKNIYVPCEYYGFEGGYRADIALVELREPFQLSNILTPACLDVVGNSEQILESGAVGKFAGFGRTATAKSSAILLTTKVPYVSYSQCKMSQSDSSKVALVVQEDKFCGGSSMGMSVCNGDSGGGLIFDNAGKSNVMGILSLNLGVDTSTGEATCDAKAPSLYTKVSNHMGWIRDVTNYLASKKTYPSCDRRRSNS